MQKTIRQAIPLEEITANMKNDGHSCKSTRYTRKDSFISEQESDARVAAVGLTFGGMALIAAALGLWGIWHSVSTAQAQSAPIYVKSELTQAQIKALNVMPARSEKHAKR
jgi:hypothetical protein